MEDVLDVYARPYDSCFPVICMDEASKQLVGEIRDPLPMRPGDPLRIDSEYVRLGTCNLFMFCEPLRGWRHVRVTERRTKVDWAHALRDSLNEFYAEAEKIVLVMDNLNTHSPGSFYEAFSPEEARQLTKRLEIHYTPKHGSWLNIAECEFSVLGRQCLTRRIDEEQRLADEITAWERDRNASAKSSQLAVDDRQRPHQAASAVSRFCPPRRTRRLPRTIESVRLVNSIWTDH